MGHRGWSQLSDFNANPAEAGLALLLYFIITHNKYANLFSGGTGVKVISFTCRPLWLVLGLLSNFTFLK